MKIMTTVLHHTQSTNLDGSYAEYAWTESSEVEGSIGWDSVEAFVEQCVDGVEIIPAIPNASIHNLPEGAVIVTPQEGDDGRAEVFTAYWSVSE